MTGGKMKEMAKFSIVLFSICFVSAALLALIFDIAEPRITEQRRLEEKRAIEEVLPEAPEVTEKIEDGDLIFYKAGDAQGNLIAYVFITQVYGYSSDIRTVVSLSSSGNIIAVKVLEQRETPGIGSRITEDDFLNQFKNKNINEQFDTITGATISSEAIINSIKEKAQELLKHEQ
jgi:electron transport complex protein RnfG